MVINISHTFNDPYFMLQALFTGWIPCAFLLHPCLCFRDQTVKFRLAILYCRIMPGLWEYDLAVLKYAGVIQGLCCRLFPYRIAESPEQFFRRFNIHLPVGIRYWLCFLKISESQDLPATHSVFGRVRDMRVICRNHGDSQLRCKRRKPGHDRQFLLHAMVLQFHIKIREDSGKNCQLCFCGTDQVCFSHILQLPAHERLIALFPCFPFISHRLSILPAYGQFINLCLDLSDCFLRMFNKLHPVILL